MRTHKVLIKLLTRRRSNLATLPGSNLVVLHWEVSLQLQLTKSIQPHNKVYYFQSDWKTNHSDYSALYSTKISMPHLGIIQSTANSYHYSSQTTDIKSVRWNYTWQNKFLNPDGMGGKQIYFFMTTTLIFI
jgi:hypothetical protein